MLVLGLDGYKGGWACVALEDGRVRDVCGVSDISEVLALYPDVSTIGIDMPLVLTASGPRGADRAAREFLRPRVNSVFFMPPLPVLAAATHAEAVHMARSLQELAPSAQAFALFKKIREAQEAMAAGAPLFEVHPEVSFRHLSGSMLKGKKTWNGLQQRLALLGNAGIELPRTIEHDIPADDLLDAAAAAWSANRIAIGEALTLPAEPTEDERAANMLVWY